MTIAPEELFEGLGGHSCPLFAGVPDTVLGGLDAYLRAVVTPGGHLVAANEGSAVALAAGAHLATGGVPVVYLQNSGLGTALNPLLSLADPAVYAIPMLLLVGWRGRPGGTDEPQHLVAGSTTVPLLQAAGIPHEVLSDTAAAEQLRAAREQARDRQGPVAILVPPGAVAPFEAAADLCAYQLTRYQAIAAIVALLPPDWLVVASTGMIARELHAVRRVRQQSGTGDFLVVGSMGHASQVALGLAIRAPGRTVVCLDGDGAALMHLGAMATIGAQGPPNLVHVILNNGAHDSVGGAPTAAFAVDLVAVALACGYRRATLVTRAEELDARAVSPAPDGPVLLEVRVARGAPPGLGRPDDLLARKARFLASVVPTAGSS